MIPLRDENPTSTRPWITYLLVALNVILFIYSQTPEGVRFMISGMMIPKEIVTGSSALRQIHTDHQILSSHPFTPVWLTIFSAMFLHASWLHLGGNMLYLWIFGNNIEDNIGHIRYLLFYLLCGIGATVAQIYSDPGSTVPNLGASGAIAGVLGAYLLIYAGARVLTLIIIPPFLRTLYLPAWLVLGFWFVLQIFQNLASKSQAGHIDGGGVAYMAHIGGFITGAILIFILGGRRKPSRPRYYDEAFPY